MTNPTTRSDTAGATAPALNPPVWSGRKTAVAAALAIGISATGARPRWRQSAPLQRKDFGALPVCGSVHPLPGQRERAAMPTDHERSGRPTNQA